MKQLGEYIGELGINLSQLKTVSGEEVGGAVNRWEGDNWRRAILEFSCHRWRNNLGTYWRNLEILELRNLELRKSHEIII